uniref:Odorant receptor n=1 Tax=Yemma signatus TaxID=300820 RepID=A0A385H633_9HEMI|nr:odorant receptor [Yemma signatus]
MDLSFSKTYRTVLLFVSVCGFPIPWIKFSKRVSILLKLYDVLVFMFSVYIIICSLYSTMQASFQDLCQLGIVVSQMTNGILITFHYIAYQKIMCKINIRMDSLTERILCSPLGHQADFVRTIEADRDLISIFTKVSIIFNMIASVLYVLPMPLMDYLAGRERARLPIPIVFLGQAYSTAISYEAMVLQEVFVLVYCSIKKIGNDCIFLSFFKIQSAYIKYLTITMKSLGAELVKNGGEDKEKKLHHWISLHQDVTRGTQELVSLYAPLIVLYYTNLICIIALGLFVQLKAENVDSIQSTATALWISTLIFVLYLQSAVADEVREESIRLASEAYFIPWYKMKKEIGQSLRLVIMNANHPILVTAYRATAFILNKETFLGFIANVITAYMGFSKIDDVLKENE